MTGRAIQRAVDFHTSRWLNVLPLVHHHLNLSAQQFRDALCLHYHRPLFLMPASCDGCGEVFSLIHALDCHKGGLVTQRHSEIREDLGDFAALGYREVVHEPIVYEGCADSPALIADLHQVVISPRVYHLTVLLQFCLLSSRFLVVHIHIGLPSSVDQL